MCLPFLPPPHPPALCNTHTPSGAPISVPLTFRVRGIKIQLLLTPEVSPVCWLVIQQSPLEYRTSDPKSPENKERKKEGKKEGGQVDICEVERQQIRV